MRKFKRIFVVDDDDVTNFITKKMLHQFDSEYQIETYSEPQDAFDILEKHKKGEVVLPDLILLDINMPGMNGFEFLEKMKTYDLDDKVHVIMFTSSSLKEDKEKSNRFQNVIGYLEKPFSAQAYGRILDAVPY